MLISWGLHKLVPPGNFALVPRATRRRQNLTDSGTIKMEFREAGRFIIVVPETRNHKTISRPKSVSTMSRSVQLLPRIALFSPVFARGGFLSHPDPSAIRGRASRGSVTSWYHMWKVAAHQWAGSP